MNKAQCLVKFAVITLGTLVPYSFGWVGAIQAEEKSAIEDKGGWYAYLLDGDKQKRVTNPNDLDNGDWASLQFTAYARPRARIAVAPVQAAMPGIKFPVIDTSLPYWYWYGWTAYPDLVDFEGGQLPVGDIGALVTGSLQNTHRFRVLERSAISDILKEQDMGAEGRVNKSTAPKMGELIGAQFLIMTSVNSWNPSASTAGGGLGGIIGGGLGGVGLSTKKARVEMTFRVVDAATGEVVDPVVHAKGESGGFKLDVAAITWAGPILAGMGHLSKDPNAAAAVAACVNKAVYQIATQLESRPWSSYVAKVSPERIFIKGGTDVGLTAEMELDVFSKGEAVPDEDGTIIGWDMTKCGRVKITSIQEKISIATIMDGCLAIKAGDVVKELASR